MIRILMGILFLLPVLAGAWNLTEKKIPDWIRFESRIRPRQSFEILLAERLCEKTKCDGFSAAEILQKIWNGTADSLEVFRISRSTAVEILHLPQNRRTFRRSEFENARPLLRQYAEREDSHPLTREFIRLNSALDLYDSIQSDFLVHRAVPEESLSSEELRKLQAEAFYLSIDPMFFIWILSCCAFCLAALGNRSRRAFRAGWILEVLLAFGIFTVFVWRGICEGRLPFASLYEMVMAVAFGIAAVTGIAAVKTKMPGVFLGGAGTVFLLVTLLRLAFPASGAFESVSLLLNSPFWLSLHVLTIAFGFCALIFSSVAAHISLWLGVFRKAPSESLRSILRATLRIGFVFSALGTVLGGFWADIAWGRFWGWDPKECAALLVLLWTLILLHLEHGNWISAKTWDALSAFLLVVIAFCLFGVNLLGVGLHSYGYSPSVFFAFSAFSILDSLLIGFAYFLSRKNCQIP